MVGKLKRAPCRGCGVLILWGVTESGARAPIDDRPVQGFRVERRGDADVLIATTVYESHFATCPKAEQFRRPKPRRPT